MSMVQDVPRLILQLLVRGVNQKFLMKARMCLVSAHRMISQATGELSMRWRSCSIPLGCVMPLSSVMTAAPLRTPHCKTSQNPTFAKG